MPLADLSGLDQERAKNIFDVYAYGAIITDDVYTELVIGDTTIRLPLIVR